MRQRLGSCAATTAVSALAAVVCARHAGDIGQVLADVPPRYVAAAVALHVATLVLRSEAWRLTLESVADTALPRSALHGANAAAFVAGTLQSQAALPARVAVLRRLAGDVAPRAGQIWVADIPIFVLELFATAVLLTAGMLAGGGRWWIGMAAVVVAACLLVAARLAPQRLTDRPFVRGLAVLADRRRRGPLVAIVIAGITLTVARLWLVLSVCGLPHGIAELTAVFAAIGLFGLLPFGPGAPVAATLAALGGAQIGAVVAAGLMLLASSLLAVAAYAAIAGLVYRLPRGD